MPNAYERVMESRKELVDRFVAAIQQEGRLPWTKVWSNASLYYNPVSACKYRGGNQLRLADAAILYGFQDTRWMTYKQAASVGLQVQKGARGVLLEKWIFSEQASQDQALRTDGKELSVEEMHEMLRPKVAYFIVFNGDQIEGLEPLPSRNRDVFADEMPDRLISVSECEVKEVAQPDACYIPGQDVILMPLRSTFQSADAFSMTLLHEMGHSTGHQSRLKRKIENTFGSEDYAREELRAELSAAFTSGQLGIVSEASHSNTAAYLQCWITVLQKDPNELFRAAADASRIADRIIDNYSARYPLEDHMYPVQKSDNQKKFEKEDAKQWQVIYQGLEIPEELAVPKKRKSRSL